MARPIVIVLIATLVLSAGCATPAGPAATPTQPEPIQARAMIGQGKGGIEGYVLDDSILPVPAANVSLLDLGGKVLEASVSGHDGSYAFSYLEPQEYRLAANAHGYANRSLLVRVESDAVATIPIVLSEVASNDPYAHVFMRSGMQTCAGRYVVGTTMTFAFLGAACANFYPGGFTSLKFEVPVGHKATVIEFDWQRKQSAGDWGIYAYLDGKTSTQIAAPSAPNAPKFPVVKVMFEPGSQYPRGALVGGGSYPAFPESSKNFTLLAQVIYGGDHVDTMQTALAPYCQTTQCWGVGFEGQWKYTTYGTIFVNEKPQGLADYSAVPDG